LKCHIFRALDDTLFQIDWARRVKSPDTIDASDDYFPVEWRGSDPSNVARREQIAKDLNQLNGFLPAKDGKAQAIAYYRQLANDALRVLAGLPGNERAFAQVTVQPLDPEELDPEDPTQKRWRDRVGPDNPTTYQPKEDLRAYIDTLDGRSTNRYFYRVAYVDGAHNRSGLSLASPPVYLPNVVPPRAPVVTKVLGGDRQIILRWASNREPDLAEYRVYRADSQEAARDLRLMTLVHTEVVSPGEPDTRPAEVEWSDPVPGLVNFSYRMVAVDEARNVSQPSSSMMGRAFDESPPVPSVPTAAWVEVDGRLQAQITWESTNESLLQYRQTDGSWLDLTSWLPSGSQSFTDSYAESSLIYEYRICERKTTGALAKGMSVTLIPIPVS
jgi:hypothetical protein